MVRKEKPLMEGHEILERKYSAIRDYPPGCGRFRGELQRSDDDAAEPCDEEEEIVPKKRMCFAIRDYPAGIGPFREPQQHKFQHSESFGPDKILPLLYGCSSEDEEEEEAMVRERMEEDEEKGEEEEAMFRERKEEEEMVKVGKPLMGSEISHKRRKYSAIRDYPPGCGRFTVSS